MLNFTPFENLPLVPLVYEIIIISLKLLFIGSNFSFSLTCILIFSIFIIFLSLYLDNFEMLLSFVNIVVNLLSSIILSNPSSDILGSIQTTVYPFNSIAKNYFTNYNLFSINIPIAFL